MDDLSRSRGGRQPGPRTPDPGPRGRAHRPAAVWHHTTICAVRRDGVTAMASDGQVTLGNTVLKHGATKLRRLGRGRVVAGFAGSVVSTTSNWPWIIGQLGFSTLPFTESLDEKYDVVLFTAVPRPML